MVLLVKSRYGFNRYIFNMVILLYNRENWNEMRYLLVLSFIMLACSEDDEISYSQTLDGRWHLDGFEENTMYVFDSVYRYTIYSEDGTFGGIEDAIPNPNPYTFVNNSLVIDLNFGNIFDAKVEFQCGNAIVKVTRTLNNEESTWIWWREGENKNCN